MKREEKRGSKGGGKKGRKRRHKKRAIEGRKSGQGKGVDQTRNKKLQHNTHPPLLKKEKGERGNNNEKEETRK